MRQVKQYIRWEGAKTAGNGYSRLGLSMDPRKVVLARRVTPALYLPWSAHIL